MALCGNNIISYKGMDFWCSIILWYLDSKTVEQCFYTKVN
ncbi:hypothetical protein ES705_13851 [subsurface metagenome]